MSFLSDCKLEPLEVHIRVLYLPIFCILMANYFGVRSADIVDNDVNAIGVTPVVSFGYNSLHSWYETYGGSSGSDSQYVPETDMCEPPAEEEKSDTVSSPIGIGIPSSRRFDDIMASITTPAPKIAPISANIRPMQDGGMAGLNRTADNFLKALAG